MDLRNLNTFLQVAECGSFTKAGERLGYVEIEGGTAGYAELLAAQDFCIAIAPEESWRVGLPEPGFVYAPVAQGQNACFAHVMLDDVPVGKVPVVYGQTVEQVKEPELPWWKKLFSGG